MSERTSPRGLRYVDKCESSASDEDAVAVNATT